MDFIRVTLIQKIVNDKKVSEIKRMPDYLLPVAGIRSVSPSLSGDGFYSIDICDNYKPDEKDFKDSYAKAKLPAGFVNEINRNL